MSLNEDLARLKIADPKTWKRYIEESDQIRCKDGILSIKTLGIEPSDFFLNAILQAVLQDACISRGWHVQQGFGEGTLYKWAYVFLEKDHYLGEGDSPAAALLAAYLEAIQA